MFMHIIINLVHEAARQNARNHARRHLTGLDDYLLNDIGITRAQIDQAVGGTLSGARDADSRRKGEVSGRREEPDSFGNAILYERGLLSR